MIRKAILVMAWFPVTAILLVNNLTLLKSGVISQTVEAPTAVTSQHEAGPIASPQKGTGEVLAADIVAGDGRALLLAHFMQGTPMEPYASYIVQTADHYGLDYRLIPAIAMCESNLGVHIPSDSFNAWGIAVYTGKQKGATFNDWQFGIDWVSQFIHDKFVSRNIIDIRDIGSIWAPPSVENGHSWANCVTKFMKEIQ